MLVGADNMRTLVHFLVVRIMLWTGLPHNWHYSKSLLITRLSTDSGWVKQTRLPFVLILLHRLLNWSIFVSWKRCIERRHLVYLLLLLEICRLFFRLLLLYSDMASVVHTRDLNE